METKHFNPVAPAKGATKEKYSPMYPWKISIQSLPRRERQDALECYKSKYGISIQSLPRRERPASGAGGFTTTGDFNPVAPAKGATANMHNFLL